ncbi:unnamed protein product [Rhizophagus irregularis]|uniref:Uncharacterized protein n=1 Tax=Rhizophagus irregularis TaxID=588596 RepID=A0A916DY67_9GLOM|nr:unnamed protein product [Rhizophagus irregularis]
MGQSAESPGRRRTLISKVSGSLEFSWMEFRRFLALWFQPGRNFQHGFLVATWIGRDFEGWRLPVTLLKRISKIQDAAGLSYRRKPKDKFWTPISKVPDSHLKNFKGPRLLG